MSNRMKLTLFIDMETLSVKWWEYSHSHRGVFQLRVEDVPHGCYNLEEDKEGYCLKLYSPGRGHRNRHKERWWRIKPAPDGHSHHVFPDPETPMMDCGRVRQKRKRKGGSREGRTNAGACGTSPKRSVH